MAIRNTVAAAAIAACALAGAVVPAAASDICKGYGPQTPRDISAKDGTNARIFTLAPPAAKMNLCNIHTHTNAEHKGPGFSVFAGDGEHGGYKCGNTDSLTDAELQDPAGGHGAFHGIKPGDTIEVHWVYTSCDIEPGKGLGSCLSAACAQSGTEGRSPGLPGREQSRRARFRRLRLCRQCCRWPATSRRPCRPARAIPWSLQAPRPDPVTPKAPVRHFRSPGACGRIAPRSTSAHSTNGPRTATSSRKIIPTACANW